MNDIRGDLMGFPHPMKSLFVQQVARWPLLLYSDSGKGRT